jgi:hypothetical protein
MALTTHRRQVGQSFMANTIIGSVVHFSGAPVAHRAAPAMERKDDGADDAPSP